MPQLALVADSSRPAITVRNEWFRTGRLCTYAAQVCKIHTAAHYQDNTGRSVKVITHFNLLLSFGLRTLSGRIGVHKVPENPVGRGQQRT